MATSSIVNTLGAGSGIDVKALAESLVEAERAPRKERIDNKIKQSETRISGYAAMKYALSELKTAFEKLNDASDFTSIQSSNSQPTAFGITAGSTASTGSYSIEVTRIATGQRTASTVFQDRNATLNGGNEFSLTLTSATGSTETITVPAGKTNPAGIASAINGAKKGVTAQLLNTGSGYQLVLSGETGTNKSFSLSTSATLTATAQVTTQTADTLEVTAEAGATSVLVSYTDSSNNPATLALTKDSDGIWRAPAGATLPDASTTLTVQASRPFEFNQTLQSAQDAQLKLNGLTITRPTNMVNDVIDGVTLNLFTSTSGAARLDLSRNTATIKENISALVTAYNDFNNTLNILGDRKSEVDQYGGSLAGDNLLQTVKNQIRQLVTSDSSTAGSVVKAARNVGISIDRNGVMQLDQTRLDSALQDNFTEVVQMFTAGTSNKSVYSDVPAGLAGDAVTNIDKMLRSTGSIARQTVVAQGQITKYKDELTALEDRMSKLLERYTNQFSVMDNIVGQSNSMRASLKNTFSAMLSSGNN